MLRITLRQSAPLVTALCLLGLALPSFAQDERERMRAELTALAERLAYAADGPAERLADQELARARAWIEQAEEATTRRNLGHARLLYNNAAMDVKVAEAMVEHFSLIQERKQLVGQVEALKKTMDEAQAVEDGE